MRRSVRVPSPRPVLAVVVVLSGLLSGCSPGRVQGSGGSAQTRYVGGDGTVTALEVARRKPAPAVSGPTLDGGSLDLADLRGKVVVVNVWASWCAPCRAEAPILRRLADRLAPRGARFVGLNVRDGREAALAFEQRFGITYPSLDGSSRKDLVLRFRDTLPPQAIPSTLVIDRQGRVAGRVVGPVTEGKLSALLEPVLAEAAR